MATPDEIRTAAATAAEEGILEAENDMGRVTAINPLDQIEAARKLEDDAAITSGNTGWGRVLRARVVPPGGH